MNASFRSGAGVALALALTACATPPADAYEAAQRALAVRDLPVALGALDAVPVGDPRYPEARAQAAEVERDLRRCHEAVHEALRLRAEWRDRAALGALLRAKEAWPTMPGLAGLIAATEARGRELAPPPPTAAVAAQSAIVEQGFQVPATPAAEYAAPARAAVPPVAVDVARSLARSEARLARGEVAEALADLLRLAADHPDDTRARARVTRLLCQRGLVRYGEGDVAAAIADFEQALALSPEHELAQRLLHDARSAPR
jgi:tetratricopeptide (TPR) repeat protein